MKYLKYTQIALNVSSIVLSIFAIGYVIGQRTRCLAEEGEEDT